MARAAMVRAVMRRPHILVSMPAVRSLTARGHPAHRGAGCRIRSRGADDRLRYARGDRRADPAGGRRLDLICSDHVLEFTNRQTNQRRA